MRRGGGARVWARVQARARAGYEANAQTNYNYQS